MTVEDFFFLLVLALPLLGVFAAEMSRAIWVRKASKQFERKNKTDNDGNQFQALPFVLKSFAIFGRHASVSEAFLHADDNKIFERTILANKFRDAYLAYDWSLAACLHFIFPIPVRHFVVVTDESLARTVLESNKIWTKRSRSALIGDLSRLACTAQNGGDGRRQRAILIASMRNRKQYEVYIHNASAAIHVMITAQFRKYGNESKILDLIPIINQASLDLMIFTIFGQETDGIGEFAKLFLPFWSLVRSNSTLMTATERANRSQNIKDSVKIVKQSIQSLITSRQNLLDGGKPMKAAIIDTLIERLKLDDDIEAGEADCTGNAGEFDCSSPPQWSREELVHNLHNLITASFETIAHSFAMSLYHLSISVDYQKEIIANMNHASLLIDLKDIKVSEGGITAVGECLQYNQAVSTEDDQASMVVCPRPDATAGDGYFSCVGASTSQETRNIPVSFEPSTNSTSAQHTIELPIPKPCAIIKAVAKEVLRIHPPVLTMVRHCAEDTTLGPYHCLKGTTVMVDILGIQRNKHIWGDEAGSFNPNHWISQPSQPQLRATQQSTTENRMGGQSSKLLDTLSGDGVVPPNDDAAGVGAVADTMDLTSTGDGISQLQDHARQHQHEVNKNTEKVSKNRDNERDPLAATEDTRKRWWLPFGAGPKNCLGQGLALMAVEQLLASFLAAFELHPNPQYRPVFKQTPTLRVSNGLHLKVRVRNPLTSTHS